MLASRIFVTWIELVVVGFGGTALAGIVSGPPELLLYFATTLVTVAVLLYNIDQLIQQRLGEQ
ncbi:hypothetical protein DM826_00505 [Halonotius aquaticus]|uniref:Uncharacterized protein n=1 Tax=Halonotius aquaticus TaxID=2216978 RepID=A0A3A6PZT3_9EURY|nr:hypothetical protein DM826_00505 [Halonotius aquaticus]